MDALAAVISFTFVASITPGPNNLMLAASGIGFGMRRTLPHLGGVSFGFVGLVLLCAAGIGAVVVEVPAIELGVKVFGSAYLVYLAWSLRGIGAPTADGPAGRPMRFHEAALFQFVNPKAWVMGLTLASLFLPDGDRDWTDLVVLSVVVGLINLPCISTWALMGSTIRERLTQPAWRRGFSIVIVVLTLYAAASLWL